MSQGFNLSVKLTVDNDTNLNNSTDKAGNGSNFTIRATLPPSVVARDVQLKVAFLHVKIKEALVNVSLNLESGSQRLRRHVDCELHC